MMDGQSDLSNQPMDVDEVSFSTSTQQTGNTSNSFFTTLQPMISSDITFTNLPRPMISSDNTLTTPTRPMISSDTTFSTSPLPMISSDTMFPTQTRPMISSDTMFPIQTRPMISSDNSFDTSTQPLIIPVSDDVSFFTPVPPLIAADPSFNSTTQPMTSSDSSFVTTPVPLTVSHTPVPTTMQPLITIAADDASLVSALPPLITADPLISSDNSFVTSPQPLIIPVSNNVSVLSTLPPLIAVDPLFGDTPQQMTSTYNSISTTSTTTERQRLRRERMTSGERRIERQRDRDRLINNRSIESASEHDRRLSAERNRSRNRIENETIEEHDRRLSVLREISSNRIENETDEERDRRLNADRDRFNVRIANESDQQTNDRQQRDRQQHRTRYANDRANYYNSNVGFAHRDAQLDPNVHHTINLGLRNNECSHCSALLFDNEIRWKSSCCGKGDTVLPDECQLKPYPTQLYSLLQGQINSSNFWKYIRRYNSAFAFASFGAQASPPPGHGPYCFRIHGQTYHRTGILHPEHVNTPTFAQIYILEGTGQLQARLNNNAECLPNIMSIIQSVLTDIPNPYLHYFKTITDIEREEHHFSSLNNTQPQSIRMLFKEGPDRRRYNAPAYEDDVAAVFVGDSDGMPGKRDIAIYPTSDDALSRIPGQLYTFTSQSMFLSDNINFTNDYLHNIDLPSLPPQILNLKIGCEVRTLKPLPGSPQITVGSRMKVTSINTFSNEIVAKYGNSDIIITKTNFTASHNGIQFSRLQFPIKLQPYLQNMSSMNCNIDPMTYPLLFPSGEKGWHSSILKNNSTRRVTRLGFAQYRMAFRNYPLAPLHFSRKLFQQFLVDTWVRIESERLEFIRHNQVKLRSEHYSGLMDWIERETQNLGNEYLPGKPIILPSSFTGGKRFMQQNYQDTMAISGKYHTPQIFLTVTCNPKHSDIQQNLGNNRYNVSPGQTFKPNPNLTASDRPDIVAAVFKLHLLYLKDDLKKAFGNQVAQVHVIEFQKRGLPHAHILIWLARPYHMQTGQDIDDFICAEIPDPEQFPDLHRLVTTCMMHGPCGADNPTAPCMVDGKCSKGFPKDFSSHTILHENGYPQYKRTNDGRSFIKNGVRLDNRYVVPYNPYFLKKYQAHINVEACMSINSIKYVFKYIYKGHDCASIERIEVDPLTYDEIKTYLDTRYLSAPEACWRIREFPLSEKSHTVYRLDVHLENNHTVVFNPDDNMEEVLDRSRKTKLTEFFTLNRNLPAARNYLYTEIPVHFTWNESGKFWKERHPPISSNPDIDTDTRADKLNIISRMYYVPPRDRERFYLRLLLLHVRGATSFNHLKFHNNIEHDTYHDACMSRGLLSNDTEWHDAMAEASLTAMPSQMRNIFTTILGCCQPSHPIQLWNNFKHDMIEDFIHVHGLSENESEQRALHLLNDSLRRNHNVSITDFGIDVVTPTYNNDDDNNINIESEIELSQRLYNTLTPDQTLIFDSIINSVWQHGPLPSQDQPRIFYIDASGGCGKTYLYNALISMCLAEERGVAACAWTGIASTLLRLGRTSHSLFKLPVPILNTSTCNVSTNSRHASYLRSLSLILVDEASMIPLHAFSAIDILMRDLCNNEIPFGGKLIVFAGDFRQTLPVTPRAHAAEILENCINRSLLWQFVKHFSLTENIRADLNEHEFKEWLLKLGDGTLKSSDINAGVNQIDIPNQCHITNDIVVDIFPNFNSNRVNDVIITPLNEDADKINNKVINFFQPDVEYTNYYSVDTLIEDEAREVTQITTEFLNSIVPSGFPAHDLRLKVGCPIMLIRNLDQKLGLCNGTRLIITSLGLRTIEAQVISGSQNYIGSKVFIPRIKFIPSELPFKFERIQFPVKLAYCLTINKSQGQEFDRVGIFLPSPVFSHGQLYVAFSRAKRFESIYVQIDNTPRQYSNVAMNFGRTINIVYNVK